MKFGNDINSNYLTIVNSMFLLIQKQINSISDNIFIIFLFDVCEECFFFSELFYFIQSDLIISKFPYRFNEITHLLINQSNDEVSRGALGPLERAQAIRLSVSL